MAILRPRRSSLPRLECVKQRTIEPRCKMITPARFTMKWPTCFWPKLRLQIRRSGSTRGCRGPMASLAPSRAIILLICRRTPSMGCRLVTRKGRALPTSYLLIPRISPLAHRMKHAISLPPLPNNPTTRTREYRGMPALSSRCRTTCFPAMASSPGSNAKRASSNMAPALAQTYPSSGVPMSHSPEAASHRG